MHSIKKKRTPTPLPSDGEGDEVENLEDDQAVEGEESEEEENYKDEEEVQEDEFKGTDDVEYVTYFIRIPYTDSFYWSDGDDFSDYERSQKVKFIKKVGKPQPVRPAAGMCV